jgi:phospholipid:diacylglycerol acyltransferase
MITHMAADGRSGALHEKDDDHPALMYRKDTEDDEFTADGTNCQPRSRRNTRNLILFAVAIFLGQIAISVSLKHYGWIEKDFNEIVAQQVVPQLEQQWEAHSFYLPNWPQFNGSSWLRINETMYNTKKSSRPGFQLAEKGATVKYPIVMIPGFVTSGLEVWQGKECARKYFRSRMWGGVGSVQQWLMERQCVLEHLALNPLTGKDPEDIRIRSAQGFESADYFMGNYWVWSKILENLADIGYDGSMMSIESYDWRLAFPKLEERDGYLTKLKYTIEAFHKSTGKKVVLTSHSLGAILVHHFFAWVTTSEANGGGGGGKDWVDRYIHTYVNIAGAQLGVPKAASALLSGEMSDTIFLGTAGSLIEQFIGRKLRRDLWTTWGSLWSMLPKGGDALWNIGADFEQPNSPPGDGERSSIHGGINEHLVVMADEDHFAEEDLNDLACAKEHLADAETKSIADEAIKSFLSRKAQTASQVIDFLLKYGGGLGPNISSAKLLSFDSKSKPSETTWHDISRTPLPHAPTMKVYCFYGVGLPTERAYFYKRNRGDGQVGADNNSHSPSQIVDPPFVLDTSVEDPDNDIIHGVKYADGDASVPLLSLGYMCADAWRRKETGMNPSKSEIVTREYKHREEFSVDDPMRGGPYSADHVDILGNVDMMEDLLKIVSDFEIDTVDDLIVSDIQRIAKRINEHPNGGLKKRKWWQFRK